MSGTVNIFFLSLSLPLSHSVFSCVGAVWWISMSTTNNIAQARKLVEQLRIEAGIERIKVGRRFTAASLYVWAWLSSPDTFLFVPPCLFSPLVSSFFHFPLVSPLPPPSRCLKQQRTWWATVSSTLVATLCWSGFPPPKTLSRTRNPASSYSRTTFLLPSHTHAHTRTYINTHAHTHTLSSSILQLILPETCKHTHTLDAAHRVQHQHNDTLPKIATLEKRHTPEPQLGGRFSCAHSGWDQYITEYDPRCFGNIHVCW